jgi:hypothetical protein
VVAIGLAPALNVERYFDTILITGDTQWQLLKQSALVKFLILAETQLLK